MAILIDPDCVESKERRKWEAQYTPWGPPARPHVHREYPMMLHLAGRPPSGMGAAIIVETQEVGSEVERELYRSRGFRATPLEALDVWEAQQREFAELAAERNYQVKHGKHSERAQAEIAQAEAVATDHLPSMPVTPIKPHNREVK